MITDLLLLFAFGLACFILGMWVGHKVSPHIDPFRMLYRPVRKDEHSA